MNRLAQSERATQSALTDLAFILANVMKHPTGRRLVGHTPDEIADLLIECGADNPEASAILDSMTGEG